LPSLTVAPVVVEMMRREAAGFGAAGVVTIGDDGGPDENDLTGGEDTLSSLPLECLRVTKRLLVAETLTVGLCMTA
jgi:hypothetical protein